jgi:hypothetical protein
MLTQFSTTLRLRHLFHSYFNRYPVIVDLNYVTRIANILNGILYLAVSFSYFVREAESEVFLLHIIPGVVLPESFIIILFLATSIPWFIPPTKFWVLSFAILPLMALFAVQMAWILTNLGRPLWPAPVYLFHLLILLVLNLICYIRIEQQEHR